MSFPGRILSSTSIFKPALSYLQNLDPTSTTSQNPHRSRPSTPTVTNPPSDSDDIDTSSPFYAAKNAMPLLRPYHSRDSSGELEPGIPLVDYSRTPSPSPFKGRPRSATQSEDEDDNVPLSLRPLVPGEVDVGVSTEGRGLWRRLTKSENLGGFLFGTWVGWQVYVGLLVVWSFAVAFVLVLMNRFILWTGVYKFPYPLAATWIQLAFTHFFLLVSASLTRALAQPLKRLGFSSMVAPSPPLNPRGGAFRGRSGLNPLHWIAHIFSGTGGVAGSGLVEFDRGTAWVVTPLAVVYVGKVVLSNISYAYAALPLYTLSRISTVPLTLLLTSLLTRTTHSIPTLSSTILATLNLLMASIRRSERVTWESIVAGVFSTLFVSLYPILLLRVHKQLSARQAPQADVLTGYSPPSRTPGVATNPSGGTKEDTRAYWQLLHYTSILSLLILTPLLLISGEIPNILHNCYFLDVPWFWFLTFLGGLASWAVFSTTLALVRATSPLTANFVGVPRAAAQMVILERFRLPVHAWVGVALCWVGSAWFAGVRREEGRRWETRRMYRGARA